MSSIIHKTIPEYKFVRHSTTINHGKITRSRDIYDFAVKMMNHWQIDLGLIEYAFAIYLNSANNIKGFQLLSIGGVNGTVMDPIMVFKPAVEHTAKAIILLHNHPSSNMVPSETDLQITRQLKIGGDALNIKVLDHIILAPDLTDYYSFADNGNIL